MEKIHKHHMLYSNPYSEFKRLKNRWHANPFVIRSNKSLHLQEFAYAMEYVSIKECTSKIMLDNNAISMTNFE